ncbi:MAG: NAD(P)H-binding protein [Pirellulales bacterium]|nr:NAD(P)H-binding protein [Pirellulales bacterium]
MSKSKILLQLDPDPQPSVFDSVVAVDAGVNQLFRHGGVSAAQVRALVHGAIFTRGPEDLKATAIFVGGSDVKASEALFDEVRQTFFGPMRVSAMLDPNGSNTTAAAAVLAAAKHCELRGKTTLVLGGTGPVGNRAARLLAREGATVRVGSRDLRKAEAVCRSIEQRATDAVISPIATNSAGELRAALEGVAVVIAAGAAGVTLLPADVLRGCQSLAVAIDLNAVPPLGIEGVDVMDKAKQRDRLICYGALGVGGTKMKIHKAAIQRMFETNGLVLDAEEIYEIGKLL